MKNNKKSSQYFYRQFVTAYSEEPIKQQKKWEKDLDIEIEQWDIIYKLPFHCTRNNKFITFQFKIIHRILSTNSLLFKCKLKETHLCSFCNETKETILHLFWDCYIIRSLWFEIADILRRLCDITLPLSAQHIIFGSELCDFFTNFLIILVKYYIYSCRFSGTMPCLAGILSMLKQTRKIEKMSAFFYRVPAIAEQIEEKWQSLDTFLN